MLLAFAGHSVAIAAVTVPLVEGLTVTTAIAEPAGDYESRKRLGMRTEDGWRLSYSASMPAADGRVENRDGERLLHDADLQTAHTYRSRFETDVEEDYPGTTALGASSEVLEELQTLGKSRFALVGEDHWLSGSMQGALIGGLLSAQNVSFKGELQRQVLASFTVIVNGKSQQLPALIATGRLTAKNGSTMDAELSFLRDPANPIALQWKIGSSALRVVRIDYPQESSALAAQLKQQKRVTLPGLYFDFGSAVLRPESAAALPGIVEAARATTGMLTLEGHTDNVGDAARNVALSRARAEAVRTALLALDSSMTARLKTEGYGAARPKASNDSLEGRAQNRRVELVVP